MKVALVCSSGGHLFELYALQSFWREHKHFWVTFPGADTQCILSEEQMYLAHCPTNRNLVNLVRNLLLAFKILRWEKPDVIISTGAGIGMPFIYVGRLLGIKTIYVELITRVNDLSLTGKLVYFVVDTFLVQWPELAERYSKTRFVGRCL